jgi:6-phosphofructokinase 1
LVLRDTSSNIKALIFLILIKKQSDFLKIGILTGGGDCAGINSAIEGATYAAEKLNHQLFGINKGWKGLIEFSEEVLNSKKVDGIGENAGTILGTSRTNPYLEKEGDKDRSEIVLDNLKKHNYDALIVIGGDDTLGVANDLNQEWPHVVGVPKTMDYDLQTYSLGFHTAIEQIKEYLVGLRTTAHSHRRAFVTEVFGRYAGHVALQSGVAATVDVILIPEIPFNIDTVCDKVKKAIGKKGYSIVVVAEGAKPGEEGSYTFLTKEVDEFGHQKLGGICYRIADQIKQKTGLDTRADPCRYVSRSGKSGVYDSFMGVKLGRAAVFALDKGENGIGVVDIDGKTIKTMPLQNIREPQKLVNVGEIALYEPRINFGRLPKDYKPKIELDI